MQKKWEGNPWQTLWQNVLHTFARCLKINESESGNTHTERHSRGSSSTHSTRTPIHTHSYSCSHTHRQAEAVAKCEWERETQQAKRFFDVTNLCDWAAACDCVCRCVLRMNVCVWQCCVCVRECCVCVCVRGVKFIKLATQISRQRQQKEAQQGWPRRQTKAGRQRRVAGTKRVANCVHNNNNNKNNDNECVA